MDTQAIQKKLEAAFGGAVGPVVAGRVESWIDVDGDRIDDVAALLEHDPDTRFECLSNLTAVDRPAQRHIQIVYHLFSYTGENSALHGVGSS